MGGSSHGRDRAAVDAEAALRGGQPAGCNRAGDAMWRRRGEGLDWEGYALRGLDRRRARNRAHRWRVAGAADVCADLGYVVGGEKVVTLRAVLGEVIVDVEGVARSGREGAHVPAEWHDLPLVVGRVGAVEVAELPRADDRGRRAVGALRQRGVPERGECDEVRVSGIRATEHVDRVEPAEVGQLVIQCEGAGGVGGRSVVWRRRNRGAAAVSRDDAAVRPYDDDVVADAWVHPGAGDVDDAEGRVIVGVSGDVRAGFEVRNDVKRQKTGRSQHKRNRWRAQLVVEYCPQHSPERVHPPLTEGLPGLDSGRGPVRKPKEESAPIERRNRGTATPPVRGTRLVRPTAL